jgi:uncharacterized membrane protein (UPF0127 family)
MRFARSFLAALFALSLAVAPAAAADPQTLEIVSKTGVHTFAVELAKSDAERAQGLMYRRELPEGRGMLFDFQRDDEVAMWMKNTYIPLDMVFIRADGTVHRIERSAEPLSDRVISSQGLVSAVLEMAGGATERLGLKAGDRIRHPLFGSR